jgi:uncharacterized protein
MRIEFDSTKDAVNQAKHGVALSDAGWLDWNTVLAKPDARKEYGELREIGYGLRGNRLYCVVYVRRSGALRIISLRKANRREVATYEEITNR